MKGFIQEYLQKMKDIQEFILNYLENDDQFQVFDNLKTYFEERKIKEDKMYIKELFRLISKITANHHYSNDFINKVEQIFKYFQTEIKNYYTNNELFTLFKNNKRILLFLFEEKYIIPDEFLYYQLERKKFIDNNYLKYFYIEFESFMDDNFKQQIKFDANEKEIFERKRKIGLNDNYICNLIQNDCIDDFIIYMNQTNTPNSMIIKESIYETNPFLLKNKRTTLIEYAAFYGSIQIFQYLRINNAKLTPSLWLYAIHSQNAEIIHLLEEYKVQPDDNSFIKCIIESIKCHHNDIACYFKDNYLSNNYFDFYSNAFHYYNFIELCKSNISIKKNNALFQFCQYNCYPVVDYIINNTKTNINAKKILKQSFYIVFHFDWF